MVERKLLRSLFIELIHGKQISLTLTSCLYTPYRSHSFAHQVRVYCGHDFSSYAWNNAVVFANSTGTGRINMDVHALLPYATLFSNIFVGNGELVSAF